MVKQSQEIREKSFSAWPILAGILLFALILRISYLSEAIKNPDFNYPVIDAAYNDYWAKSLATGDWSMTENSASSTDPEIRSTPYIRPPGYPYLLALCYYLTGHNLLAARIIQMAIGMLSVILAYFLGKIIFGQKPGLIFAALVSSYWIFIYFEGELLETALSVTLSIAVIYSLCLWCKKIKFRYALLSGVLFGLSALLRPNILLFGPIVLLWTLWVIHRRHAKINIAATWLFFVAGGAILILPVTIRNYVAAHDTVLITSNLGINLHIGNNETSTGTHAVFPELEELTGLEEWTSFDYPLIVQGVEKSTGQKMKYSEVSSYFTKKAVNYAMSHKLRTMKMLAVKTALFWGPTELQNNKKLHFEKLNSRTFRYMPGFPMALTLGILGIIHLFVCMRNNQQKKNLSSITGITITDKQYEMCVLIILFIMSYFASVLPFFIVGRFRVPIIPFLLLFGGFGLYRTFKMFTDHQLSRAFIWTGIYVTIYVLSSIQIIPYEHNKSEWHLRRANSFHLAQKDELALSECFKAVELNPDIEKGQRRLADLLMQKGDFSGSIKHYNEVVRIKPGQFNVHYNLALAYNSSGQIEAAIEQYYKTIEIKPDFLNARRNLALELLKQKKYDDAITQFKELIRQNPNQADVYNSMGIALKSKGMIAEAIENYQTAIKINPNYYNAYNNLGNVMVAMNQFDQAINYYREALKIKPDYAEAQHNLDILLRTLNNPDSEE